MKVGGPDLDSQQQEVDEDEACPRHLVQSKPSSLACPGMSVTLEMESP